MKIGFTGHRNAITTVKALEKIAKKFPGAVWVHGGAGGFDSQVERWAQAHGITTEVRRPDYSKGRAAPLIRNREIVSSVDVLFACWDGRARGGTAYTVSQAIATGRPVWYVTCIRDDGEMCAGNW